METRALSREVVSASGDARDESLAEGFIRAVWRYRRSLLVGSVVGMLLLTGIGLLRPRHYTAYAAFQPAGSSSSRSRLSGLAAQLGVVAGADQSDGPRFYADLLRSRELLRHVAQQHYQLGRDDKFTSPTLIEVFGEKKGTPPQRLERVVDRLLGMSFVSLDRETSVVTLTVTAESTLLAQQICAVMLSELNEFNLTRRQNQASSERAFVEKERDAARSDLRTAEEALRDFRGQNRSLGESPDLALGRDRLAREISMRQQLYTTLSEAYNQARIDEVRNTPALTIIEPPREPAEPDSRLLLLRALLGLFGGAVAGVILSMIGPSLFHRGRPVAIG
jgi:uncharacterized protein involved in exopolysaccharide biosynthesis